MNETMSLKMSLPRIPEIELVALEGLERLARHLGIAGDKIGEARIIVTEAIINAFEHGGPDTIAVRVEFTMTTDELTVFVRDSGQGIRSCGRCRTSIGDGDRHAVQTRLGNEAHAIAFGRFRVSGPGNEGPLSPSRNG